MIRLLILILIVLSLGALGAYALRLDSGYVLLAYRDWVVETSLIGYALATAVLVFALIYSSRLLLGAFRLPDTIRQALDERRHTRAQSSFVHGLEQLLAGEWKQAEVELVRRAADHPAAQLNYLFAARAAQLIGATDRRDHYLNLARQHAGNTDPAVSLNKADLLASAGERDRAVELLQGLLREQPRHGQAGAALAEIYAREKRWADLRGLLNTQAKHINLSKPRQQRLMRKALTAELDAAGESGRIEKVKAAWSQVPSAHRGDAGVRNAYARALVATNAHQEAEAVISRALNDAWDAELVDLYGRIEGSDGIGQLATIEQWLNRYGDKHELLLVAGRACRRNRLWGKARSYLDGALKKHPSASAYLELARLCSDTQQAEDAARFYRKGLELSVNGS